MFVVTEEMLVPRRRNIVQEIEQRMWDAWAELQRIELAEACGERVAELVYPRARPGR